MAEPSFTPYHGLLGAHGGAPNTTVVSRGESLLVPAEATGKAVRFPIQEGDLVQILKWGGGGYGDPLERDSRAVLEDVRQGYVSSRSARELYGIVLAAGTVDAVATRRLRERLRADRVYLTVVAVDRDTLHDQSRLWLLAPEAARRLGCGEGEMIECIAQGTAPLRGRVRLCSGQAAGELPSGPFARKVFRAGAGARVWVRRVFNPMQWELGSAWPSPHPAREGDS